MFALICGDILYSNCGRSTIESEWPVEKKLRFAYSQELEFRQTIEQPFRYGHQLVGVEVPAQGQEQDKPGRWRTSKDDT